MDKINIFDTTAELCESLTKLVINLLDNKQSITINLSGGSTPKALFQYWAQQALPWDRICFYWGDERCVEANDEMSNYGMTKKYLFDKINIPEGNIFRIRGEAEPQQEALRYAGLLPASFDLILLGMGDDGHTASIFPYNIHLWDSSENCIVAAHPDTGMLRVSITGRVINTAQQVAFLITGKNKASKVKEVVLCREVVCDKYPAARVNPVSGKLYFFLDKASASEL